MPPLDADRWAALRAAREAGESVESLAERYGVGARTISRRAKQEGWAVPAPRAPAKARSTPTPTPAATPAEDRAAVLRRHQREWAEHQQLIDEAIAAGDFDQAKLAKITAETIRIRQEGERKAWGLNKPLAEETATVVAWPLPKGELDR